MSNDTGDRSNLTRLAEEMGCPDYDPEDLKQVQDFSFIVEGILQTIISILGIFGNTVAAFILSRKEMRNAFNLLLITLACFDSTYLFGSILESFRKPFDMATLAHIHLFPYLLYPMTQLAVTGSIFMTVAIALERYIAVHFPLDYSQAMHEANALSKRILKYVSAVLFLSVAFTITRFFEAKVVYEDVEEDGKNITTGPHLEPTDLRTDPAYTLYFNWSRLIVLGIVPFAMLVYLNANIYQDIKARRTRRFNNRSASTANNEKVKNRVQLKVNSGEGPTVIITSERINNPVECVPLVVMTSSESKGGLITEPVLKNGTENQPSSPEQPRPVSPKIPKQTHPTISVNESRRKKEDNMAVIFMGFILVFLVCHLPRLLLNIHELVTLQHAMECQKAGLNPFPLWSLITITVSHILLVINSSTNIFIYCILSSKFREEITKVYQSFMRKVFQY